MMSLFGQRKHKLPTPPYTQDWAVSYGSTKDGRMETHIQPVA